MGVPHHTSILNNRNHLGFVQMNSDSGLRAVGRECLIHVPQKPSGIAFEIIAATMFSVHKLPCWKEIE